MMMGLGWLKLQPVVAVAGVLATDFVVIV